MPEFNKDLFAKAKKENIELYSDREEKQKPHCVFGLSGVCCKICSQGPCKVIPGKCYKGVCGADADLIVSRNLLRTAASGASCHIDHAREMALALLKIGESKTNSYHIHDVKKLKSFAKGLGIKIKNRSVKNISKDLALEVFEDFRRQEGLYHKSEGNYLNWLKLRANKKNIQKWKKLNILPVNADMEISRTLHSTTMGNNADPKSIFLDTLKMGLVDGYSGLVLSSDLQDIIFGTPSLVKAKSNLGVLKKDYVNLVIHGHVPLLSEKVLEWSKKLNKEALKVGAKGVNVVGMCCSGLELLMRQGAHIAGHMLQQELAIVTGVVDAAVVDIQCIFPSLQEVSKCYHTKLITTIDFVKIPGALHIPFKIGKADLQAKKIVREAISNFKNRTKRIFIPKEVEEVYAGFSVETILSLLKKVNSKDPLNVLVDALKKGDILGIVGIVGCRNPKVKENFHEELTKLLIKNNILVVGTGCWAHAAAQAGLCNPLAAKFAGSKLRKVLKLVGEKNNLNSLPAALHMGGCVDSGRIGVLLGSLADKLKVDISSLPCAGSAPEYVTEKAVAIGMHFLSLGLGVHINPELPISGSQEVVKNWTKDLKKITGGNVIYGKSPQEAAKNIIKHIKDKRKKLGWK